MRFLLPAPQIPNCLFGKICNMGTNGLRFCEKRPRPQGQWAYFYLSFVFKLKSQDPWVSSPSSYSSHLSFLLWNKLVPWCARLWLAVLTFPPKIVLKLRSDFHNFSCFSNHIWKSTILFILLLACVYRSELSPKQRVLSRASINQNFILLNCSNNNNKKEPVCRNGVIYWCEVRKTWI